jgi:Dolichyl-phosphate-mannose-protein mannosyltransferase
MSVSPAIDCSRNSVIAATVVILVGLTSLAVTHRQFGTLLRGWDPQFYFAQAHSLFLRRSADLTDSIEQSPWAEDFGPQGLRNLPRHEGRVVNKYPIGLSLIEGPFLLLGDRLSLYLAKASDTTRARGWYASEVLTVAVGLFLVSAIGLLVLYRQLEALYGTLPAAWGIACCWFGTSLFYYTSVNPFLAHGVAFTLVVLAVWQSDKLYSKRQYLWWQVGLLGVTFGLLFLVRPQQILLLPIVLLFLLRTDWRTVISPSAAVIFSALFFTVCLIQPLFYYISIGSFTLNAYAAGGEGFNFFSPDWFTVLCSPSRGLFFFSPIVVLSLLRFAEPEPLIFAERVLFVHGVTQAYLIMCWSSPDQGWSFGARMWCEAAALVAFFVARITYSLRQRPSLRLFCIWLSLCLGACLWTIRLMFVYNGSQGGSIRSMDASYWQLIKAIFTVSPG